MPTDPRAISRLSEALVALVAEAIEEALARTAALLAEHDARLDAAELHSLLSAGEVGRRLDVSAEYARGLLADEGIPVVVVGTRRRYPAAAVNAWLARLAATERPRQPATIPARPGVTVIASRRKRKRAS